MTRPLGSPNRPVPEKIKDSVITKKIAEVQVLQEQRKKEAAAKRAIVSKQIAKGK